MQINFTSQVKAADAIKIAKSLDKPDFVHKAHEPQVVITDEHQVYAYYNGKCLCFYISAAGEFKLPDEFDGAKYCFTTMNPIKVDVPYYYRANARHLN